MIFWQNYFSFINSSEFIRAIAVISIIVIMYRMNLDPRIILQSIVLVTCGVFGFWIITNMDYLFYSIFG